ncbi:MAG: helix-turn-helix domain-containing protein [Roseburia sp.]|nr:helix-turn-helix domain-containing protein [Roseburia sp.]
MDYKVGKRIRELREMNHYTREVFAEKVEISPKFLYEIETGRKGFSADVLLRMSKAFSVSCEYIMLGEDMSSNPGNEKLICILEQLEPKQKSRMQNIVQILYEMCESI